MRRINYWAVVVAILAAFAMSSLWYSPILFGAAYDRLRGVYPGATATLTVSAGQIIGELIRSSVVVLALAGFVALPEVETWRDALRLGIRMWFGFAATILLGAVIHDGMSWTLYAIHAGDWLVKTLLIVTILGMWRGAPRVAG
jgi:hypothetical protein